MCVAVSLPKSALCLVGVGRNAILHPRYKSLCRKYQIRCAWGVCGMEAHNRPDRLWNCDESGLCNAVATGKVLPIRCCCDNAAVVALINAGYCKHERAMHLLKCLFFIVAHFDFDIYACHIPGSLNVAADALSRDLLPLLVQPPPCLAPKSCCNDNW